VWIVADQIDVVMFVFTDEENREGRERKRRAECDDPRVGVEAECLVGVWA